jgi:hypothetical protein
MARTYKRDKRGRFAFKGAPKGSAKVKRLSMSNSKSAKEYGRAYTLNVKRPKSPGAVLRMMANKRGIVVPASRRTGERSNTLLADIGSKKYPRQIVGSVGNRTMRTLRNRGLVKLKTDNTTYDTPELEVSPTRAGFQRAKARRRL